MNQTSKVGRLLRRIAPKWEPPMQTGMDITILQYDKIQTFYIFLY